MKAKRIVALLLALVMILGLTACGGEEKTDPAAIVAKVGDVEVTQRQWDAYNALVCYGQGYDLSAIVETEETKEYLDYLKNSMLSSLMSSKVLELDYAAQGVDVLGETYEEDIELFLSTVKAQIPDFLEKNDLTDEELTMYYNSQQYLAYSMN